MFDQVDIMSWGKDYEGLTYNLGIIDKLFACKGHLECCMYLVWYLGDILEFFVLEFLETELLDPNPVSWGKSAVKQNPFTSLDGFWKVGKA